MAHRVCPWWLGYFLASPLRRWRQDPTAILSPWVGEGQVVLEPGPGMGFFTLELARLVGPSGRVVAVELQPKMLDALKRRARRAGCLERIAWRLASRETMSIADLGRTVDFTLAFAVVHEFPDALRFFSEVAAVSKQNATLLFAEPKGHVSDREFASELEASSQAGFKINSRPAIRGSHTALLSSV
jgi:ubiquinone/menaquinone biosynthesis C-methylase UbiE